MTIGTSSCRAARSGRRKQRAGFGTLILIEAGTGFTLPRLPRDDAIGRAHSLVKPAHDRGEPLGVTAAGARQLAKSHHDKCIAREHRQPLAEGPVHRRQAPPGVGVVKAGKIIVHQRCAVQKLERSRHGISQCGIIVATGQRHRQAQLRTNSGAAREYGMLHGLLQPGRGTRASEQTARKRAFDSIEEWHEGSPLNVTYTCHLLCPLH